MYEVTSSISDALTVYSPCVVFAPSMDCAEGLTDFGQLKYQTLTNRRIQTLTLLSRKEGGILDGAYKQDPRHSKPDTQPNHSNTVSRHRRGGSMSGKTAKKSGAPARTPAINTENYSSRSPIPNQQEAVEEFVADYRQDSLPPLNMGLYEAFIAHGSIGVDALSCYLHLCYTYRRQHTDRVRATRSYLMRGLHMGRDRVIAARALLDEMGLTEAYVTKDQKCRITGHYVRLCLQPNPGQKNPKKSTVQVSHTVDDPHAGARHQMLEEEIQTLEEVRKKREPQPTAPTPPVESSLSYVAPQHGKEQKLSRSPVAALKEISRSVLGRETDHVRQAIALQPGADHEEICEAWEIMLTEHPSGAAFFAKDYATRWAPKARKAIARRGRKDLNAEVVRVAREELFVPRQPGDEETVRELAADVPWRRYSTKLQHPGDFSEGRCEGEKR